MEMHTEQDEQLVIARAQAGDLEAFNELVVKYQDVVFAQTMRLVGDPALGKTWRRIPSSGPMKSWVVTGEVRSSSGCCA